MTISHEIEDAGLQTRHLLLLCRQCLIVQIIIGLVNCLLYFHAGHIQPANVACALFGLTCLEIRHGGAVQADPGLKAPGFKV